MLFLKVTLAQTLESAESEAAYFQKIREKHSDVLTPTTFYIPLQQLIKHGRVHVHTRINNTYTSNSK